jgi:hypothetical protein
MHGRNMCLEPADATPIERLGASLPDAAAIYGPAIDTTWSATSLLAFEIKLGSEWAIARRRLHFATISPLMISQEFYWYWIAFSALSQATGLDN